MNDCQRCAELERRVEEAEAAYNDLTHGLREAFAISPHPPDTGSSMSSAGFRQGFRDAWEYASVVVRQIIRKDDGSNWNTMEARLASLEAANDALLALPSKLQAEHEAAGTYPQGMGIFAWLEARMKAALSPDAGRGEEKP